MRDAARRGGRYYIMKYRRFVVLIDCLLRGGTAPPQPRGTALITRRLTPSTAPPGRRAERLSARRLLMLPCPTASPGIPIPITDSWRPAADRDDRFRRPDPVAGRDRFGDVSITPIVASCPGRVIAFAPAK